MTGVRSSSSQRFHRAFRIQRVIVTREQVQIPYARARRDARHRLAGKLRCEQLISDLVQLACFQESAWPTAEVLDEHAPQHALIGLRGTAKIRDQNRSRVVLSEKLEATRHDSFALLSRTSHSFGSGSAGTRRQ